MLDEKEIEQIKLICETLRGPMPQQIKFDDAAATVTLALELLRIVNVGYYGVEDIEGSSYSRLRSEVKKLALEFVK